MWLILVRLSDWPDESWKTISDYKIYHLLEHLRNQCKDYFDTMSAHSFNFSSCNFPKQFRKVYL